MVDCRWVSILPDITICCCLARYLKKSLDPTACFFPGLHRSKLRLFVSYLPIGSWESRCLGINGYQCFIGRKWWMWISILRMDLLKHSYKNERICFWHVRRKITFKWVKTSRVLLEVLKCSLGVYHCDHCISSEHSGVWSWNYLFEILKPYANILLDMPFQTILLNLIITSDLLDAVAGTRVPYSLV